MLSTTARPLTKSDFAYRQLRRRIVDAQLAPGTRLRLRPLADELGVSVIPVRDALRMLEADGLVTLEDHRGATVTEIPRAEVLQIIATRLWLEILAVREATPRHTPASLKRVEQSLADAEHATAAGDARAFTPANRALHEAIEAPAPEPIRRLIGELWERLWQTRRTTALFERLPDRIPAAHREHTAIVTALRAADPDAAAAAMERHRESTLAAWPHALDTQN